MRQCPLLTQSEHSTRCLAPEPRPLTTPLSSEIASGLSRVFMLPPPHGEQQQREEHLANVFMVTRLRLSAPASQKLEEEAPE
jgi:hypothetical protein